MCCALPGCTEWKLLAVLTVCRTELTVEVRQPPAMWASVQAPHVPFRLKEFVVTALWRKLPVAQRLNNFQVLGSVDCPLCGVLEDHSHVFKKCFFLQDSLAFVRRLCGGVHVSENAWHEPSRMCTDYAEWPMSTRQGWLVWSAVCARWLIRREALSERPPDTPTTMLQRFFSILLTWKAMPKGALPREVVHTTYECIKDILRVRGRPQGLSKQQGIEYRLLPLTPSKVIGKNRPTCKGLCPVGQPTHTQIKAWVAVVAGENAPAYGATFGVSPTQPEIFA